jgi:hypothetical protein
MESTDGIRPQAIEEQKTANLQSAFDLLLRHASGIPSGWFNARQVASLMGPEECSKLRKEAKSMDDLFSRINLAYRRACALYGNRRTSVEAARAYKSEKERLKRLAFVKGFSEYGINIPDAAFTKFVQQADNGVELVNYDDEMAALTDRQVKDAIGDHCKAITAPSTNPNVIEFEKRVREEFGVKVNFGDNLVLAQQTYEVCEKVQSLGHKFPKEIIFADTGKTMHKGATVRRKAYACIIISNIDLGPASTLVVDASFKGALFHEFGHVNSKSRLFPSSEFSKGLEKCCHDTLKEFALTLPNNEGVLQKLERAIGKNEGIGTITNVCYGELSPEVIHEFLSIVTQKMNEFVDKAEDCLEKRIAKEVSLYAATSKSEFMAEVYCGLMLDKTYSEEIIEEYKKLGGRPFK